MTDNIIRRHYIRLAVRVIRLWLFGPDNCPALVSRSYNRISSGYDNSWTNHMRDLTAGLINSLNIPSEGRCLDLTCGTGYATGLLAARTGGAVYGIDRAEGMLEIARQNYGDRCEFIESDILTWLKACPADSFDIITCCWGLGYSRPWPVIRQMKRILKPGGQIAIIDNSLLSLREILYCSWLTFAEQPGKLANLMRFSFLPGSGTAALLARLAGLRILERADGEKRYRAANGQEAIRRLQDTGAAAGFEYAASEADSPEIFARFAEIINERYNKGRGIDIVHRYLQITAYK